MCTKTVFSCSEILQKRNVNLGLPERVSTSGFEREFLKFGAIVSLFIYLLVLIAFEDVFSYRLIFFEAGFIASGWDPGICYVANYVFVHLLLLISFITAVLMRSEGSKFRVLPCGAAHEGYKVFCLPFDAEFCLIRSLPILV